MNLKSKTALITGGNSGLGFEIAKQLVKKNSKVIILGKDKKKITEAAKKLNSKKVTTVVCNLRDYKQIKKAAGTVKNIDILINCAGVIMYSLLEKSKPEKISELIEVNLLGTIFMTREILPKMKKQNSGTIFNVITSTALKGRIEETIYTASKKGVMGFTEALKEELEELKSKINVTAFYPGGMNTKLFEKARIAKDTNKFMNPLEIAKIIVFILERPESIRMSTVVVERNKNM